MFRSVLSILVLFLLFVQTHAQEVKSSFSKNKILIGEQVYLTLKVNLSNAKKIQWPVVKDTLNKYIEVLDSVIGADKSEKKYLITSFDSGYYALPPFVFFVDEQRVETSPLLLEVHTVAVDTTKEFRDIKNIVGEAGGGTFGANGFFDWLRKNWYYVLPVVLLLAFVVWWFFIRKKAKTEDKKQPEIVLPLHEQLLRDLNALEQKQLWQNNQTKLYYIELTDVLRTYIEKRYNVSAHEQTTIQLIKNLKTSGIAYEAQNSLKGILEMADMVKFAKAIPTGYENQAVIENAKKIAELTKVVVNEIHG